MDRTVMKVVGRRRRARVDVETFDVMQKTVNVMRAGRGLVPKGVFRFKSVDEADAWLITMMASKDIFLTKVRGVPVPFANPKLLLGLKQTRRERTPRIAYSCNA